jgi:hypothetical protein
MALSLMSGNVPGINRRQRSVPSPPATPEHYQHHLNAIILVAGVWCLAPGHAIKGTVGGQRGTE